MHYYFYPTKDSWISSGSSHIDGTSFKDANYGQDQILELKKEFWNKSFDYPTRVLVQFNVNETGNSLSKSVADGDIPSTAKYYLRLFEADGTEELTTEYNLAAFTLSQSWDEGIGKYGMDPKVTDGVSWDNTFNRTGASEITWSNSGTKVPGGYYASQSGYFASQSFSYESPDINMDITDIVNKWLNGTSTNYGLLLRFSGSQETDSQTFGKLKFFSYQTHTIYPPKLEVRWDNHTAASGSNTGSLSALDVTGNENVYLYLKGLRDKYKEGEKAKFRIGARKQYIAKTYSTSVQTTSPRYVPEKSGSYSIIDSSTGETIVPFEDIKNNTYTYLSCDVSGSYFTQWLNSFQSNRIYKILLKLKTNDGQELIFDDDYEFKVVK